METEKFCLRWNEFESNLGSGFRELRDEKDFFDVTLACDDDQQIQVHKVIISACSSFFKSILRRNPHQHPLLYLKGVKFSDLQAILNFIYQGEVNVAQEDLNSFLMVAEELKIKGLTQAPSRQLARKFSPPPPGLTVRPPSRRSPPTCTLSAQPASPAQPTPVNVKAEPRDGSECGESSGPEERRAEGVGEQQMEPHDFPLVSIPGLAGNETNKGGFSRFIFTFEIYIACVLQLRS